MQVTRSNGLVKPCCMPANCVRRPELERPGVVVKVCRTCGARHIEMAVEPGRAFAKGANM
jgi:hypothetical protein